MKRPHEARAEDQNTDGSANTQQQERQHNRESPKNFVALAVTATYLWGLLLLLFGLLFYWLWTR